MTPGQSLPLSSPPASAADDAPQSYIADELSARSRDSEVIAAFHTPPPIEAAVSAVAFDLPPQPDVVVASVVDNEPKIKDSKRVSKDFERSHLFLELNDAKLLNAIVAQDCRHLLDQMTAPHACDDARQRLIASRTRLPITHMKKVIYALASRHFPPRARCLTPLTPQIAYLGEMKDMPTNSMFAKLRDVIPCNETLEKPYMPLLRSRSMSVYDALVRPPPPPPLQSSPHSSPSPPSSSQKSINGSRNDNSTSLQHLLSAVASVAKTGLHTHPTHHHRQLQPPAHFSNSPIVASSPPCAHPLPPRNSSCLTRRNRARRAKDDFDR